MNKQQSNSGLINKQMLIYLLLISAQILLIHLYQQKTYNEIQDWERTVADFTYLQSRLEMFNESIAHKIQVNGYYRPSKGYYCVWAEGRTMTSVEKTESHEYCHYLTDKDYKHFCEGE